MDIRIRMGLYKLGMKKPGLAMMAGQVLIESQINTFADLQNAVVQSDLCESVVNEIDMEDSYVLIDRLMSNYEYNLVH